MATVAETLHAIEVRADRAIVNELRLLIKEVQALQPSLLGDDRAHAHALLLKLDHLHQCQMVDSISDQPFFLLSAQG